ncbi:MAG: winged helix-turn-helix transcriptional regulator [Streptomycetales bacterium]
MSRNVRTYDHFCVLARALERVGDRWSLLVIRDLLSGPKRFTDLMDRLGGITPKTLTKRLHELGEGGILEADRKPGRREVRYQLTPAGAELAPAVDALSWWGWQHAWRPPHPGEALHVEHLLRAITQIIDRTGDDREPACWHFRFRDDGDYLIENAGGRWSLTSASPSDPPDVTIIASTAAWAQFVSHPAPERAPELDIEIDGSDPAIRRFAHLLHTVGTWTST